METSPHTAPKRPPVGVWLALSVVIFFLALSAADSVGFVPYYIDGTAPASEATATTTDESAGAIALTELSQLQENSLVLDSSGRLLARATPSAAHADAQLPVHLTIGAIGLDLAVQNPSTVDVNQLDALLVNGPARYRDSAKLGEDGNVIIFAHSSHLPIVHNQMYKAFNRIPELGAGDLITLTGEDGTKYLYSVQSV
jgi:hypothetical protein